MKKWWIIIILLGAGLRLIGLGSFPKGMTPEEGLLNYRGGLLREEGRDELGRKWPIVFSSFRGFMGPGPSYLAMIGGGRWPMAIVSVLGLIAFGMISKSLTATAVLALSPTMIMLARSTSEWSVMLNLTLIFLVIAKKRKILLLVGLGIIIWWLWVVRSQFNFADDISIINAIDKFRANGGSRWFYNKSFYGVRLAENFFQNIKPQYWFAGGDKNSIYGQSNYGLVLAGFLPAFLIGLIKTIKEKRWWLIIILGLGVIPSVLSYPSPNQERIVVAMLMVALICGRGMKKWIWGLVAINLGWVMWDGIRNEPGRMARIRNDGVEEMAERVIEIKDNYEMVWLSDNYCPDVGAVVAEKTGREKTNLWGTEMAAKQWINKIGKIIVGGSSEWQMESNKKILLVTSGGDEEKIIGSYKEIMPGEEPRACWQLIEELKNYKLWKNTGVECE